MSTADISLDRQFSRIAARRRLVQIMRGAVPAFGVVVLLLITAPSWIGFIVGGFGFGGVRVESGKLVIERPRLSGALSDGGTYELEADYARTAVASTEFTELSGISAEFHFGAGDRAFAGSDSGMLDMAGEVLDFTAPVDLITTDGLEGRFEQSTLSLPDQVFTAESTVTMRFENGSSLDAASMRYDANKGEWLFKRVTLVIMPKTQETAAP